MAGMFDQAKAILKAKQVQGKLAKTEIEATGGDGLVTVVFTGDMKIKSIQLGAEQFEGVGKEYLERVLRDTLMQAMQQAQQVAAEQTKAVMKELGVNIPGM